MPAFTATAPGKVILFGEHAVVYNRPAIAVPVTQAQARATVTADLRGSLGRVWIDAPAIKLSASLESLSPDHPFNVLFHALRAKLGVTTLPAMRLRIASSLPVAAGMGSGAAVSVAILRAVSAFLGQPLEDTLVCELAFQTEKAYHSTPSGIDNTVITYARPVFFRRGQPLEFLQVVQPFTLIIAQSGIASSTASVVNRVRRAWEQETERYEMLFDRIGAITNLARQHIVLGQPAALGQLMNENHSLLCELGVSCPELDHLVQTAQQAGVLGAKLSGAGGGGNMIALTLLEQAEAHASALLQAGATSVIVTTVQTTPIE